MKWILMVLPLLVLTARAQSQPLDPLRTQEPCAVRLPFTLCAMPGCNMTLLVGGPVVFTSEDSLRARLVRHSPPCDTAEMPRIDFGKQTLIGRWITLGNCPAGKRFSVSVCRDDSARVYRHIVAQEESPCRGLSSYMSWILVPRLPEGYRVVFE